MALALPLALRREVAAAARCGTARFGPSP